MQPFCVGSKPENCYTEIAVIALAGQRMSKQSQTLIYFVGGLADLGSTSEYPFEKVYGHLDNSWKQLGPTPISFNAGLHSFRQSTCIPTLGCRKYASAIPLFTDQTAEELANQIDEDIERERRKIKATEIVIVAYSSGSALVRRAILQAKDREWERKKLVSLAKDDSDSVTCCDKRLIASDSWSEMLTKVIHIGGMTVGWEFNSQMPKHYLWLGPILRPFCPYWFPWQIYRGSKFITDTRIGLNQHHLEQTHQTFYLLGTQDQFLSPGDAVEPGGRPGNDPIYLEVAGFDHNSILNYADHQSDASKSQASKLDQILKIIIEKQDILGLMKVQNLAKHIPQEDIDDYLNPMDSEPARRNEKVEHVVIVLHGIRDSGFWAKRIAHRIKKRHREIAEDKMKSNEFEVNTNQDVMANKGLNDAVRVVSLGYGYFSLWDFLRPGGRRQAVEWFQNVYADITALYPRADVSFIGHSNGTYLGTHALQCENVKFRYLVLAGSVVRQDFWDKKGKTWNWDHKVGRLLNLQGVDDWIVGLLPGGLETIPILGNLMDLGGLGAYGNRWLSKPQQVRLVGGHGAGIIDEGWDNLARFVLEEDQKTAELYLINKQQKPIFKEVNARDQLRLNHILRIIRPIGGIYIYIALLICFSPLLQLVWMWFGPLDSSLPFLPSLELPSLHLTRINQLPFMLLLPIGALGSLGLIGNLLKAVINLSTTMEELIDTREKAGAVHQLLNTRQLQRKVVERQQALFFAIIYFPLALILAKVIAVCLQGFQTVMALLLILSILSFSLLKRI
jgi:hypothetical protein